MKSIVKHSCAFLLFMALAVPCVNGLSRGQSSNARRVATAAAANTTTAEIVSQLERDVPSLMNQGDVPGMSIALIRNGELVWHRGFGVKNSKTREPVTDNTVFEAASLSKPVFAYAVMKLVDAGKIDLDKPLTTYLPGTYDVGDDARLNQITARMVLSHRSGFPNWRPEGGPLKIHFTPGERFSYSGEGFVYLSKVVEKITGENFNDFMKRTVFNPLSMTDSSYVWQDSFAAQAVFRHNGLGEPAGQNRAIQPNAAASLQTTARDFGKFVVAVLNGTGLKKQTAAAMLTEQVKVYEGGANTIDRPLGKQSNSVGWALGWGVQTTSDGPAFWHWGDNGNSKAFVIAFERGKNGVVMFANSSTGLSIASEIVGDVVGGEQPALTWIAYESYKSPARLLFKSIVAKGAEIALKEYREWRKGRPESETVNERQINRIGYDLLYGAKRTNDAVEVFKLNVEDYPESSNTYDSLGEAYMVAGNKELAIKNYKRSVELNPKNTGGIEALKKLEQKSDANQR